MIIGDHQARAPHRITEPGVGGRFGEAAPLGAWPGPAVRLGAPEDAV